MANPVKLNYKTQAIIAVNIPYKTKINLLNCTVIPLPLYTISCI